MPKILVIENFSPASLWRNYLKTQAFSWAKCCYVALFWPIIPCRAYWSWLWDGKWNVRCIEFPAAIFLFFFENFRPEALRKKFSKKCLHYLKFSGFSVLQKDAHHMNWKNISSKMYSSAFWFKFRYSSGLFLWIYCRKLSKKGFLETCRVFPKFFILLFEKQSKLGFVTPTVLPVEKSRGSRGTLGRK